MIRTLRNQKGLSILEVLIGFAMIALVGSFFVSGMVGLRKVAKDSGTKNSIYKQINDVIESIRPNVKMYQVNYLSSDQEREQALAIEKLPMAWGNGVIADKKDCSACPGRYGFVIQAYPNMKGLYLVTLRMTHKDWVTEEENGSGKSVANFVDYQFVVNAQ